jgi:hypothetical protein
MTLLLFPATFFLVNNPFSNSKALLLFLTQTTLLFVEPLLHPTKKKGSYPLYRGNNFVFVDVNIILFI